MKQRAKVVVPVALAVILAAVALWWWGARDGRAAEAPLEASGTVEATEADLAFRAPGRVAAVTVQEGDAVVAGQELAVLDRAELTAGREAAAAQLAAAEARLGEMEAGARPEEVAQAEAAARGARRRAEEAAREAARAERLFEGGAVSRRERDQAATAAEVARAAADQAGEALSMVRRGPRAEVVAAQRAQVAQARAQLDRAEAALENGVVRAPFAGTVAVRHREPGEVVPAGAPVLTLRDPDDRWVRIYVPEDRIGRVAVGQTARITADTYPDRSYAGRVVFIGSEAEFTPRNVQTPEERTRLVYPVKVRITGDAGHDLKPGIPADVALGGEPETP